MVQYKSEEDVPNNYKKFCECGCGELIWIYDKQKKERRLRYGHYGNIAKIRFKGKHFSPKTEFKKNHVMSKMQKNAMWKGGKYVTRYGYVMMKNHQHPRADKNGYVFEHIIIIEKYIGRYLNPNEVVHHKNHNTQDNRLDNLQLMLRNEHARQHRLKLI